MFMGFYYPINTTLTRNFAVEPSLLHISITMTKQTGVTINNSSAIRMLSRLVLVSANLKYLHEPFLSEPKSDLASMLRSIFSLAPLIALCTKILYAV
jgi:hypothetical protein